MLANVTVPSNATQIRFKGVKGSSSSGDMAIDSVKFGGGQCAILPLPPATICDVAATCSFERSSLCGWRPGGRGAWQQNSAATPTADTGPLQAQAGASYIFLEADLGKSGDISYLTSPYLPFAIVSMSFYYHMYGKAMGKLWIEANVAPTDTSINW
eukprot:COSAG01_NODE_4631_length_4863_cov_3.415407_3_plen_156_part_00